MLGRCGAGSAAERIGQRLGPDVDGAEVDELADRGRLAAVGGQSRSVTPGFRALACQLWDAWWDKTPPQRTPAERRAAALALRQAARNDWPAAAGLDEDQLDEPGYRPWSHYRPAVGTGEAPDCTPAQAMPPATRRIA